MLTTGEYLTVEDYAFKSSPESCSGNSYSTDCTDLNSDEDFLQQLSSDLDIPLLLNGGEDELSLLNSFFDKSPEEIMSETALSPLQLDDLNELQQLDLLQWGPEAFPNLSGEVKREPSDTYSNKSNSPTGFYEVKDELKSEPASPSAIVQIQSNIEEFLVPTSNNNSSPKSPPQQNSNKVRITKLPPKRIPIQPKAPYTVPGKNKVIVLNGQGAPSPKVMVLENITAVPVTNVAAIAPVVASATVTKPQMQPMVIKSNNIPLNISNIDPKILKRQQRKIKNRESACLSRKKKKDYLTSLENKVKELTIENQNLKMLNKHLQERLSKYEGIGQLSKTNVGKAVKSSIVLCMVLFSLGFHLDFLRGPFAAKNQMGLVENNIPKVLDHHSRNLLWADDSSENSTSNFLPFSMCPAAINQTESARLVLELERWIGKPKGPLENQAPTADPPARPKSRKRKFKKFETRLGPPIYRMSNNNKLPRSENTNELQVFTPAPEQLYSEFFEAINRQDDTFYVVSFSAQQLLLPALHHNKTRRPKMSLIMPSVLPNGNSSQPTLVPLMQIDCEVLDTRLIQIRYGSIPQHLRDQGNTTNYQENSDNGDVTHNSKDKYSGRKAYKPYFVKGNNSSDIYNLN